MLALIIVITIGDNDMMIIIIMINSLSIGAYE